MRVFQIKTFAVASRIRFSLIISETLDVAIETVSYNKSMYVQPNLKDLTVTRYITSKKELSNGVVDFKTNTLVLLNFLLSLKIQPQ